ncbi:MAG: 3-phosphoshikimate 1-carboxyvinyltransferase [Anaerolineales bacterium]
MSLRSHPAASLRGSARLPGDKSISHRAALLGAMADGRSRIDGMLRAGVTQVMLQSLADLHIDWTWDGEALIMEGAGRKGFPSPSTTMGKGEAKPLNCGNSATTMRLLTGALAGQPVWNPVSHPPEFIINGSQQLQKRPMNRVIEPLCEMGAEIRSIEGTGCAPLAVRPTALKGIEYRMPVASAQVKSAILFAGLYASGSTLVEEPSPSRDHTERLLRWLGARVEGEQRRARVFPLQAPLPPLEFRVPGDFSSAAFLLAAASIVPGSEVLVQGVGLNPRRTGLLAVLRRMGADIDEQSQSESAGEPVGDLRVRAHPLQGTVIDGSEVVDMIDEFPVLAVAAACADGITEVRNAAELRHKESDRISVLAVELRKLGIAIEESPDGFSIRGPADILGGHADSHGDHRLAMSLAVAGMASQNGVEIGEPECIGESFPGFESLFNSLGARLE